MKPLNRSKCNIIYRKKETGEQPLKVYLHELTICREEPMEKRDEYNGILLRCKRSIHESENKMDINNFFPIHSETGVVIQTSVWKILSHLNNKKTRFLLLSSNHKSHC